MSEKESLFVKPPQIQEKPDDILREEMLGDIAAFPVQVRPFMKNRFAGMSLSRMEQTALDDARNEWWLQKYGFPFGNNKARNEVLFLKYAPPEEKNSASELLKHLMRAIVSGDETNIASLKQEYQKEFPDEPEGIEVLFGLRESILIEKDLHAGKIKGGYEAVRKVYRNLTEYQFLLTHFILMRSGDKVFMQTFWKAMASVAERMNALQEFNGLQRGQVSQVAVHKIIEQLGEKPKLAHPDEDAFESIDLWSQGDTAIQIKGWSEEEPAVLEVDHVAFPAARVDDKNGKSARLYNSAARFQDKKNKFYANVKKYGKKVGKHITGHMLVVPYSKIDFVTGEPAPELVDFFRKELGKKEKPAA